jgi:hypothetical protein
MIVLVTTNALQVACFMICKRIKYGKGLACAPSSLQSKIESWVAVLPIVTGFLCSVERRFSVL